MLYIFSCLYDYLEELYEEEKDKKIKEDMKKITKELKEKYNYIYPREIIEEGNI